MASQDKLQRVAILGGGISGITTGIVLQIHGFMTTVYTDRRLDKIHPSDPQRRKAEIASIHAAASVLPHSAGSNARLIDEFTRISQMIYRALAFNSNFGVRQQRHYELNEDDTQLPTYAREVKDFTRLSPDGDSYLSNRSIPLRKGATNIYGWYFNAFFVEVPSYMRKLYELYEAAGGAVEELPLEEPVRSLGDFEKVSSTFSPDAYVVSVGFSSPSIISGQQQKEIPVVRGHMIRSKILDVPQDPSGAYFSYNYIPSEKEEQYTDRARDPDNPARTVPMKADVYFYPRSDGWLLGGSRQEGFVDTTTMTWRPDIEGMSREEFESEVDYFKISDSWPEKVPRRIWDLNRELIFNITRTDISLFPSTSYVGYRFLTDPMGVGIEAADKRINDKPVLGNYGHGGSGYTLSWGCAWKILVDLEAENFATKIRRHRDLDHADHDKRPALAVLTSLEKIADRLKQERSSPDLSKLDY